MALETESSLTEIASVSILNSRGAPEGGAHAGKMMRHPERVLGALTNFFYWSHVETFEAVEFPRLPQLEDTGWSLRLPRLTTSGSRPWRPRSLSFFMQDFLLLLGKSYLSPFFSAVSRRLAWGSLLSRSACFPLTTMVCLLLHP